MEYREYLDKFIKEAQAIGRTVADATKETAEKAKTKIDIKRAEIERDKAFTAFGRIMYQIEKGTLKRDDSIVAAGCQRIEEQEKKIEELKAKDAEAAKEAEEEAEQEEEKAAEVVDVLAAELEKTAVQAEAAADGEKPAEESPADAENEN